MKTDFRLLFSAKLVSERTQLFYKTLSKLKVFSFDNMIVEFNEQQKQRDYLVEQMEENQDAFESDTSIWRQERGDEVLSREVGDISAAQDEVEHDGRGMD